MLVHELMTPWVLTVPPDTTIQEAARKMRTHRIGMLPVSDNRVIVGVVTDRDIVVRAVAEAKHAKLTSVQEVMSPIVVTCLVDNDLEDACALMEANHIRRILVRNHEGRLAGVLSVEDIASRAHKERLTGQTLRGVVRVS
jgi:CBS domain-containing protein